MTEHSATHEYGPRRTPNGSPPEHGPLPLSKPTRVYLEAVRTLAAVSAVVVNCLTCLKVFGVL